MDLIDQSDRRFYEIVQLYKSVIINMYGRYISAQDVAKFIGLMCRAHINLIDCLKNLPNSDNTYFTKLNLIQNMKPDFETAVKDLLNDSAYLTPILKADSFVNAIREISPNLNWSEICFNLDHPEFIIKDRIGLNLLLNIISLGSPSGIGGCSLLAFSIYHHWQNVDGQYSLVSTMLKNPDLFSFANYIYAAVQTQLLKTLPEMNNKEIATWRSLHLVDILLYFADNGYIQQVNEIFKFPVQNCPDLLFLALIQISSPITISRKWFFSILIPTFLEKFSKFEVILRHAWNSANFMETLRPIIMNAMSDWYIRGDNDESRLFRILNFALEYNALLSFLDIPSFIFVIELACLASRRNYLILDIWLNDKIFYLGEPFVVDLVKFLQRRYPQITGVKIPDDQTSKNSFQLPHESVITMLTCLKQCIGYVSLELNYIIVEILQKYNIIFHNDWTTSSGCSSISSYNEIHMYPCAMCIPYIGYLIQPYETSIQP